MHTPTFTAMFTARAKMIAGMLPRISPGEGVSWYRNYSCGTPLREPAFSPKPRAFIDTRFLAWPVGNDMEVNQDSRKRKLAALKAKREKSNLANAALVEKEEAGWVYLLGPNVKNHEITDTVRESLRV